MTGDRHIDLSAMATHPVAVLGLGKSGLATARALQNAGVEVWAWDDSAAARDNAIASGVALRGLETAPLAQAKYLILSPGIPHTHPAPHPVVPLARGAGCAILSDVELLLWAQNAARVVAITGTNGKSTTTALLGHILADGDAPLAVGGNLGVPALSLPALGGDGIYVLELSSYQLELVPSAVFDIAVLLNISPDHLDRHGGLDGYVAAKMRIFDGQRAGQTAIIGVDDDVSRAAYDRLAGAGNQRVVPISAHGPVDGGVYAQDGWLVDDRQGSGTRVIDLRPIQTLPGWHNAQNAAAAYAAAAATGMAGHAIAARMASYPGLAHRQELVDVVDGVLYINDSKATNADAAARALE
ncbi:MAG: UDP-N-acetylmuramoyl-L-alanine--D-glutamate ligase, partial [Alphaproteobacteria bacterium]